jgi:hypothetical protein
MFVDLPGGPAPFSSATDFMVWWVVHSVHLVDAGMWLCMRWWSELAAQMRPTRRSFSWCATWMDNLPLRCSQITMHFCGQIEYQILIWLFKLELSMEFQYVCLVKVKSCWSLFPFPWHFVCCVALAKFDHFCFNSRLLLKWFLRLQVRSYLLVIWPIVSIRILPQTLRK